MTTVAIHPDDLRDLDCLSNTAHQPREKLLHRAITDLKRKLIISATNEAYAHLKRDPQAWAEELAERDVWNAACADGDAAVNSAG